MGKKPFWGQKQKNYNARFRLYFIFNPFNFQVGKMKHNQIRCHYKIFAWEGWNGNCKIFYLKVFFDIPCYRILLDICLQTVISCVFVYTSLRVCRLKDSTWQLPFCSSWEVTHVVFHVRYFSQIVEWWIRGDFATNQGDLNEAGGNTADVGATWSDKGDLWLKKR